MENFPPNSKTARTRDREKVERVTSSDAVRRKKPLGRHFSNVFFGGDARTAWHYMITNVAIPAVQDTIIEMVQSGIERMVRGENRSRRGTTGYGHVNYRGFSQRRPPPDNTPLPTRTSRASRARHVFDEIIIPSRQEAEEVLDRLYDLIDAYEGTHTDHTWGWTELRGANVARVRNGGYLLDLPEPEFLG